MLGLLASCRQEKMPDVAALAFSKGAVLRGIKAGSQQYLDEVSRHVASRVFEGTCRKGGWL